MINPLLNPCSPPFAGRGGIFDPGLYVMASEEAKLFAETIAPYEGNASCLTGALRKGLELCSKHPQTFLQPSPKICPEKGLLTSVQSQAGTLSVWIQQKVTPAFVLTEYISSQESKRYLGALRLHLLQRAIACSGLSPFCNAPQVCGRGQILPADRDVSAAPCKLQVSEAPWHLLHSG